MHVCPKLEWNDVWSMRYRQLQGVWWSSRCLHWLWGGLHGGTGYMWLVKRWLSHIHTLSALSMFLWMNFFLFDCWWASLSIGHWKWSCCFFFLEYNNSQRFIWGDPYSNDYYDGPRLTNQTPHMQHPSLQLLCLYIQCMSKESGFTIVCFPSTPIFKVVSCGRRFTDNSCALFFFFFLVCGLENCRTCEDVPARCTECNLDYVFDVNSMCGEWYIFESFPLISQRMVICREWHWKAKNATSHTKINILSHHVTSTIRHG